MQAYLPTRFFDLAQMFRMRITSPRPPPPPPTPRSLSAREHVVFGGLWGLGNTGPQSLACTGVNSKLTSRLSPGRARAQSQRRPRRGSAQLLVPGKMLWPAHSGGGTFADSSAASLQHSEQVCGPGAQALTDPPLRCGSQVRLLPPLRTYHSP